MNKRIEKMVKNYEAGKLTVRRDQLRKAVEEGAFAKMIVRPYDECFNIEPYEANASVENIPDYWFRGANIWISGIKDNMLKVTMCYGQSYKELYADLEEKEVATIENTSNTEGIEVEEIDVTEEVEEMLKEENTINPFTSEEMEETNKIVEMLVESGDALHKVWINEDDNCIYGLITNKYGHTYEQGLYAPSYDLHELQGVYRCLASKIVNTTLPEGMEEVKGTLIEVNEELNNDLIIHIEGEGSVEEITTSNILKATENLNARILAEYNEDCGGYSKIFITITTNGENYKFRYDIDNKLNLSTNIFKFMLEQEKYEYNYTINNIEKFKWINEENYKNEYKVIFELLNDLIEKNNIDVKIENNPYTAALEKIKEVELYEVSASHNWIMKDNRLIKNEYFNGVVLATGKAIKEFISEGKRIDVFNLKRYKGNLKVFTEGLYKCDTGKLISLIPTKEDRELMTIKMLPRLENELARI